MRLRSRMGRIAGFGVLLILFSVWGIYLYAITNDIYTITLSNVNINIIPRPKPTPTPVIMYYPATTGTAITYAELVVIFTLLTNGTMAERVPVNIANADALVTSSTGFDIAGVVVAFEEAIINKSRAGVLFNFNTVHNDTHPAFIESGQFYFPFAGDYSPTIYVWYSRGQHPQNPVRYTYTNIKVRVASNLDLQNQKAANINIQLTYALVAFAGVEIAKIVWDATNGLSDDESYHRSGFAFNTSHHCHAYGPNDQSGNEQPKSGQNETDVEYADPDIRDPFEEEFWI